jgi:hypothetical protein
MRSAGADIYDTAGRVSTAGQKIAPIFFVLDVRTKAGFAT